MSIKDYVVSIIKIDKVEQAEVEKLLAVPPSKEMGDFALPCFVFAKTFRKSPNIIAEEIVSTLKHDCIKKAEAVNGYVNIYLNEDFFTSKILTEIFNDLDNYGKQNFGQGKLALIEFSSINVAKNPHVGHLGSTLFGECFSRLHENFGFNVKRLNYLGDYGTQFGKMITAYLKWGNKKDVELRGVDALQELYIRVNKECEENEELLDECRNTFLRLEQGDKQIKELYDWFVKISLDEANKIYEQLEVKFDDYRGESYYAQFNDKTLKMLEEKGLTKEDQGALIVDLNKYNLGVVIVKQKNGASLYATRDISLLIERYNEYRYDKLIYVTAVQQKQHFSQIFQIGRLLGLDYMDKVHHASYGMISLPGGKISSRKGAVALIKDLFAESTSVATEVLKERQTIADNIDELAKSVGIGALTFSVLKTTANKDCVFDFKSAINFDGETGPYLQYTHARCRSVVEKANIELNDVDFSLIKNAFELTKELEKFPQVLVDAFNDLEPSYIARYAISLAGEYNKFYNNNRIITDDAKLTKAQVALTKIVKEILRKCLTLLVIKTPDKM